MQVYNQSSSNANLSGFNRLPNFKKALSMPVLTTEQTDVYFGSGRVTRSSKKGFFSSILGGGGEKPPRKPGGKKLSGHETAEQTTGAGSRVVRARRSQSPESASESSALSSVGSQTPSLPASLYEGEIPKKAFNSKVGKHYRRKSIREANPGLDVEQLERLYNRAGVPTGTSAHASKSAQELLDSSIPLNPSRRRDIRNRMKEEGQDNNWTEAQINQRIEEAGLGLQKKPISGGGATARQKRRQRIEEEGGQKGWTPEQINQEIEKAGAAKRPRGGNKKPLKPAKELGDNGRYKRREAIKRAGGTEDDIVKEGVEKKPYDGRQKLKPGAELKRAGKSKRRKRIQDEGQKKGWTPGQITDAIKAAGVEEKPHGGYRKPPAHAGSGNEGMENWVATTPEYQTLQQQENQGYGSQNPTAPLSSSSGAIFNMPDLTAGLGNTDSLTGRRSPSSRASVAASDHAFVEEGEAPPSPMHSVHSASPPIPIDPALEASTTTQNAQLHGRRAASPFTTLPSGWYSSPPPPEPRTTYRPPSMLPHHNYPDQVQTSQAVGLEALALAAEQSNYSYQAHVGNQSSLDVLAELAERSAPMPRVPTGTTPLTGYPASPFSVQPPRLRSTTPPFQMIPVRSSSSGTIRMRPNRTDTHYWDENTGNWEIRPSRS